MSSLYRHYTTYRPKLAPHGDVQRTEQISDAEGREQCSERT